MNIEYEITFPNIKREEVYEKLKLIGAEQIRTEFYQKRINFDLAKLTQKREWIRLRTDGLKNTLAYKSLNPAEGIVGQKELEIEVSSFEDTKELMILAGAHLKNQQENKREIWKYKDVEIMIDEWPFLEPFLDIEGKNEVAVKNIVTKLGLSWSDGIFENVTYLYMKKYKIGQQKINNETPILIFDMENPFL